MLKKGFLKPQLSISILTPQRFYLGLLLGLLSSLIINMFLDVSYNYLRGLTLWYGELLIPSKDSQTIYNYFFSTISTILGLGLTLIFWFGSGLKLRHPHFKLLAINNIVLLSIVLFLGISRLGMIMSLSLYNSLDYNGELSFLEGIPFSLLLLIPIYLFVSFWQQIQLSIRIRNWKYLSIPIVFFLLVINKNLTKKYSIGTSLDQEYVIKNELRWQYLAEIEEEASKHGIIYPQELIKLLQREKSSELSRLRYELYVKYEMQQLLSLDSLYLSRMTLYNISSFGGKKLDRTERIWYLLEPLHIYYQICHQELGSAEMNELFEVLEELGNLLQSGKKEKIPRYNSLLLFIKGKERYVQYHDKLDSILIKSKLDTNEKMINDYAIFEQLWSE